MSNESSLSGFKVGKLYICRNPLPMEYDEWWWVLFAGINNWDEKTNKLYENDTFMVLEIFSDIATVSQLLTGQARGFPAHDNEFNEYENWIKVLTDAGVIGWFKYSFGHYQFFELAEELKLC
jgi:hypothetical protein